MSGLPIRYYSLLLLILTVALTGCELRRDSSDFSDPGPVSDLPPTLAPLGAETDLVAEATAVPTVIAVQINTEQTTEIEAQVIDNSDEAATEASESTVIEDSSIVSSDNVAEVSSLVPDEFVAAADDTSTEDNVIAQEAIVVDATSDDLPIGGPVAANPPASQTTGSYDEPAYGDGSYAVRPGDTLFSIAQRHGTSVDAILFANGLSTDFIQAGQVLAIPSGGDSVAPQYQQIPDQQPYQQPSSPGAYLPGATDSNHIVVAGETLYRIALQYGTSVDAIAGANGIPHPYIIQAGQQLVVPAPGTYAGPPPPPPAAGFYEQPYQGNVPPAPNDNYYAPQDNYSNPGLAGTHTVGPGETLYSIALTYGSSAEALATANGLVNPNQIYVGQVLYLP